MKVKEERKKYIPCSQVFRLMPAAPNTSFSSLPSVLIEIWWTYNVLLTKWFRYTYIYIFFFLFFSIVVYLYSLQPGLLHRGAGPLLPAGPSCFGSFLPPLPAAQRETGAAHWRLQPSLLHPSQYPGTSILFSFFFFLSLFFFGHAVQLVESPTRDWTWALDSESSECSLLDGQRSP